jgi:hypothetical protein
MNKALRVALFVFLVAMAVQVFVGGRADMRPLVPALLGVVAGLAVLALGGRGSRGNDAGAPEA